MDNAMIACLVPACPGQVLVDLLRLPTATLPGASAFALTLALASA